MGNSSEARTSLVHEAGGKLSYRSGKWGFIPPYKGEGINKKNIETGSDLRPTLWDLESDPMQRNNLAEQYPEITKSLWIEFSEITEGYYNPKTTDFVFGTTK